MNFNPTSERVSLVVELHRGSMRVLDAGELVKVKLPHQLPAGGVAVGDEVRLGYTSERILLLEVLPRRSALVRLRAERERRGNGKAAVLAANVDLAVIVASLTNPNFHPRLIDRYLILCQYSEIAPVLCLNKCDLTAPAPDLAPYRALAVPVVHTSAHSGMGLEQLRGLMAGKTVVFSGHSGVGKSSLLNALLGEERLAVGAVRAPDGRGRHTTSSSTLLSLDEDTRVIDTPGIRALGLDIDTVDLRFYFPEFTAFSEACRFRDCAHSHEPDCAVADACAAGAIPAARYASYRRMLAED